MRTLIIFIICFIFLVIILGFFYWVQERKIQEREDASQIAHPSQLIAPIEAKEIPVRNYTDYEGKG